METGAGPNWANLWQSYEFRVPFDALADLQECTANIVRRESAIDLWPEYDIHVSTSFSVPREVMEALPSLEPNLRDEWWAEFVDRTIREAKEWCELRFARFDTDYPAHPQIVRGDYVGGFGRKELKIHWRPRAWNDSNFRRYFWRTQYSLGIHAVYITYEYSRHEEQRRRDTGPLYVDIWIHRRGSYARCMWEYFVTWVTAPWVWWTGHEVPFPCDLCLQHREFLPPNPSDCLLPRMNTLFKNPLSADYDM